MMTMPVNPSVKNFLIADLVFRQDSGKWCLIGVFDAIDSVRFPVLHRSLGLFVELADAQGKYDVRVDFVNSKDQVLAAFKGLTLRVGERLVSAKFGIQTHNLPIPEPGTYFFRLYFNDQLVPADIRIIAREPGGQ